ncbi:MAG: hypothetical protein CFE37_04745 [Alphaproteobacteria bacterium PA4]|nr:MAG: hypothetical protein CFE37_04745 [Alphaproteobacteria bacterium PA4]
MAIRYLVALTAAALLDAPASQPRSATDAATAKALAVSSCMASEGTGSAASARPAVLVPGLTPAHMAASRNPEAQAFFDQGLGQLWGFDYDEALKSFARAAAIDADCVLCSWGQALALGPYINSGPIDAKIIARARLLTEKALATPGLSERDRALLAAVHARHAPGGTQDGVHADGYAETMLQLAARWPEDDLVAILAAEAVMDAQPWDYWLAGGKRNKGRAGEAIRLVETVLARSPDHPQAIHLLIHLTEASADPARAAGPAARLGGLAPAAPHMVHMPSHTWYRIGRYQDAIAANQSAIAADTAYARATGADPQYYGYFLHHNHFLAASAMQTGDKATALAAADALEAAISPATALAKPYLQGRLATALQARAHFLAPADVLALPAPDARLTGVRIAWHGVRGEALARLGRTDDARAELVALRTLRDSQAGTTTPGRRRYNSNVLATIADSVVRGRIAEAEGRSDEALRQYRAAEAIASNQPYAEPPLWPIPVSVLSGQLRLKQGDRAGAAADFRRALAETPGNSLASAGLAAARGGMS